MTKKKQTQEQKAKTFMKERKARMKSAYKILKPRMDYCEEFDILYIAWGQNKCESTIELSQDVRVDVDSKGTIIGIEIEDFSKHQKENKL